MKAAERVLLRISGLACAATSITVSAQSYLTIDVIGDQAPLAQLISILRVSTTRFH